jgi:hypothetical protein
MPDRQERALDILVLALDLAWWDGGVDEDEVKDALVFLDGRFPGHPRTESREALDAELRGEARRACHMIAQGSRSPCRYIIGHAGAHSWE